MSDAISGSWDDDYELALEAELAALKQQVTEHEQRLKDAAKVCRERTAERDEARAGWEREKQWHTEAMTSRGEAVALLRAIWHGEDADKWPDPTEFRRRVEALVGPSPTGQELAVTYYERIVPRIEDLTFVLQEYEPIEEEQS